MNLFNPLALLTEEFKGLSARRPGTFFESREWKSWAACRRPKSELWDVQKTLGAKAQRTIAATYRIRYLALAASVDASADLSPASCVGKQISELEESAKEYMKKMDTRLAFSLAGVAALRV